MVPQSDLELTWTLVTTDEGLLRASETLFNGSGPAGVDAERASGYKYGAEAYLVQVFRKGAGTFLFDPLTIKNFSPLANAIRDEEWIFHAASQDLACLAEIDLVPTKIFDTELASRLLGFERVGLGSVVSQLLDITLDKAHSAADWSTRPLPNTWLEYAALDVALLPDLRNMVALELDAQGKTQFAAEEFAAVLNKTPKAPVAEPWRKLAGGNRLKTSRELAIARELWNARDRVAREQDVSPGRLLPDKSLIVAAATNPRSKTQLNGNKEFRGRASRTHMDTWWQALVKGKTAVLPQAKPKDPDAIPNHRGWALKHPEAANRLQVAREAVAAEAERLHMPIENLLTPELLRRISWQPPETVTAESVAKELERLGARNWQTVVTSPIIADAFVGSS